MNKKVAKRADETLAKIRAITRHIRNVQDNCLILGEKLIQLGDIELGHQLIAHGFSHDNSKFFGIEWDNLTITPAEENKDKLKLKLAIQHHNRTNLHHPEAWPFGIKEMPLIYQLEMLCDWKARSEEFGTALIDYIHGMAMKRFSFSKEDEIYKILIKYADLLCEKPFGEIK